MILVPYGIFTPSPYSLGLTLLHAGGRGYKIPPAHYATGFPFEMKFHELKLFDFYCISFAFDLNFFSSLQALVTFWQPVFCRKSPPFLLLENAHIRPNWHFAVSEEILQGLSKFSRGVLRPKFFFKLSLDMCS